jgi:hypothetical protein
MKEELLTEYVSKIAPILDLAKKAYGSRDTKSPQHDASREYTRLLLEFYSKGGSLLQLAAALGVTYAGLRRRIVSDQIPPKTKRTRSKATPEEMKAAAERIAILRTVNIDVYHEALRYEYEVNGISMSKLAKIMGLSSANPLYYGITQAKIKQQDVAA